MLQMQDHSIASGCTSAIYVIFRVYNLGQDNMGLKIYLDPETSRQLEFTAQTWSVVPVQDL